MSCCCGRQGSERGNMALCVRYEGSCFKQLLSYRTRSAKLPRSEPLPTTTTGHNTACCKNLSLALLKIGKSLPETCWSDHWRSIKLLLLHLVGFYITLPTLMMHGQTQIKSYLLHRSELIGYRKKAYIRDSYYQSSHPYGNKFFTCVCLTRACSRFGFVFKTVQQYDILEGRGKCLRYEV